MKQQIFVPALLASLAACGPSAVGVLDAGADRQLVDGSISSGSDASSSCGNSPCSGDGDAGRVGSGLPGSGNGDGSTGDVDVGGGGGGGGLDGSAVESGGPSSACAPAMGPLCARLSCTMLPAGADNQTINAMIQASPPGTTFGFPAGTWHRLQLTEKDNDAFIGDASGGTILTGDDAGIYSAFDTDNPASGVVVRNLTIEHYGAPTGTNTECGAGVNGTFAGGPSGVYTGTGWVVDHVTSIDNSCDGLSAQANVTVIGGRYSDNGHAGIESSGQSGVVIEGAEIAFNNTESDDPGNDAAGLKMANQSNVELLYNYVHDNNATGLWADIGSSGWVIDGNTVVNNRHNGIQYEISTGAVIRNNVVNGNGGSTAEMQIYVSSSGSVQVYDNNVRTAGPAQSIVFQDDKRSSPVVENVVVHDNTVTFSTTAGVAGFWNTGGSLGNGNSFDRNAYYVSSVSETHWSWGSFTILDWDTYRSSTGQDVNGSLHAGDGSAAGSTAGCRAVP